MSRVVTAFCIMIAIAGYSVFAALVIRHENSEITKLTDEIIGFSENGDSEKAYEAAEKLSREWNAFEKRMSVFIRDDKLYSISESVARIAPYIDDANDELEAELQKIDRQLDLLYRSELPMWYNIL